LASQAESIASLAYCRSKSDMRYLLG
jgi:hypothetical protein